MPRLTALVIVLALAAGCAPPPAAPARTAPAAPAPRRAMVVESPKPPPNGKGSPMSDAEMTPEKALERLFTAAHVSPEWFTSEFIAKVPVTQIEKILHEIARDAGAFRGVRSDKGGFEVAFERASVIATVRLDHAGRFSTLFVRPGATRVASLAEAVDAFRALPGEVSVVVVTDGAEVASLAPDRPLGVGSTFKLAALAALRAEIDRKKRAWSDVVELRPEWRSLPSGMLQDWPAKSPVTLHTLATLMISISDNTATDAVIDLVGRAAVEAYAPSSRPLLTTAEMFRLKGGAGDALERFRKGDLAVRRAVLAEIASAPLPEAEAYPTEPTALDVEWFFSTRELCALMAKLADLPMLRINPGVARRSEWETVAYKGGSEPGVINMTTWLGRKGKSHCVSATWNREEKLDDAKFSIAYATLLGFLARAP